MKKFKNHYIIGIISILATLCCTPFTSFGETARQGSKNTPTEITWSSSGRYIAISTFSDTYIYDEKFELIEHIDNSSRILSWRSEDDILISSFGTLFCLDQDISLQTIINDVSDSLFTSIGWNFDGSYLIAIGQKNIFLWDASELTQNCTNQNIALINKSETNVFHKRESLSFHPQKDIFAVVADKNIIYIRNIDTLNIISLLTAEDSLDILSSPQWNQEGTQIMAMIAANRLLIWDVFTGDTVDDIEFDENDSFYEVIWTSNPSQVALLNSKYIKIWDIEERKFVQSLEPPNGYLMYFDLHPNGNSITGFGQSFSGDKAYVWNWNITTGEIMQSITINETVDNLAKN